MRQKEEVSAWLIGNGDGSRYVNASATITRKRRRKKKYRTELKMKHFVFDALNMLSNYEDILFESNISSECDAQRDIERESLSSFNVISCRQECTTAINIFFSPFRQKKIEAKQAKH